MCVARTACIWSLMLNLCRNWLPIAWWISILRSFSPLKKWWFWSFLQKNSVWFYSRPWCPAWIQIPAYWRRVIGLDGANSVRVEAQWMSFRKGLNFTWRATPSDLRNAAARMLIHLLCRYTLQQMLCEYCHWRILELYKIRPRWAVCINRNMYAFLVLPYFFLI